MGPRGVADKSQYLTIFIHDISSATTTVVRGGHEMDIKCTAAKLKSLIQWANKTVIAKYV